MKLRYRAWDKEENRWINIASLVFDEEGELWYLSPVMDDFNPVYYENELSKTWEIMQSTGLKDKNGVEIFEGDVVIGEQNFTNAVNVPRRIKGVVKYSDERTRFYLEIQNYNHSFLSEPLGDSVYLFEVIGNIYENSDLLDGKKRQKES